MPVVKALPHPRTAVAVGTVLSVLLVACAPDSASTTKRSNVTETTRAEAASIEAQRFCALVGQTMPMYVEELSRLNGKPEERTAARARFADHRRAVRTAMPAEIAYDERAYNTYLDRNCAIDFGD